MLGQVLEQQNGDDRTKFGIIGRLKPDGGDSLGVRADRMELRIIGGLKPDGWDIIIVVSYIFYCCFIYCKQHET
jgi:hypothetical protein